MAEARALAAGPYAREMLNMVVAICAPFFWLQRKSNGRVETISNGTVFFVNTIDRVLAVTADHVFKSYIDAMDRGATSCQFFDLAFDPQARLIDNDSRIDIATFDITREEIAQVGKAARPLEAWPPIPPEVDRGIYIAGYPGVERRELRAREVEFGIYAGGGIATTVTPKQVSLQVEHENLIDNLGLGLPQPGYDTGGMSGGPVLTLVQSLGGIVTLRLGGVIVEARKEWDLFLARRGDLIRSDGTLDRSLFVG